MKNETTKTTSQTTLGSSKLMCLVMWLRQRYCAHEFVVRDLISTGIAEPDKPINNSYDDWAKYYNSFSEHDSHCKRVYWPCNKCGKTFYAHCGLDISPTHGLIVKG